MEERTYGELVYTINSLGTVKEILASPELINEIINCNDKKVIFVFAELINHALAVKEITHKDLINLRDIEVVISLIHNNDMDVLLDKIKYLCYINDSDIQIMLYTNPYIINYVASDNFDLNILDRLTLDTNLEIIKKLIEMKYVEKAHIISEYVSRLLRNERLYKEERESMYIVNGKSCK